MNAGRNPTGKISCLLFDQRAEKITELDRFRQVVTFIAMLPIDPDIFDTNPSGVAGSLHGPVDPFVINRIAGKGFL